MEKVTKAAPSLKLVVAAFADEAQCLSVDSVKRA